jgi:hypothetical protein
MNYVWTLLIGLVGGWMGVKFRLPAGALIGALIAVGSVNALQLIPIPTLPAECRFLLQVCLGIFLGTTVTGETVQALQELWRPALTGAAIMVVAGILSGLAISQWLGLERMTALLGSAPGGTSVMSLIALDMGVEGPVVAAMHLTRMLSVVLLIPLVVRVLVRFGLPVG